MLRAKNLQLAIEITETGRELAMLLAAKREHVEAEQRAVEIRVLPLSGGESDNDTAVPENTQTGGDQIPANQRRFSYVFSVGIETPRDDATAFGMVVPALFRNDVACVSAADTVQDIGAMVREAILLSVELLVDSNVPLDDIKDAGIKVYQADPEWADYDTWLLIDVDLSVFDGKPQHINASFSVGDNLR